MQSRFEQRIAQKIEEAKSAMVKLELGNSHGHAELKGFIRGLTEASSLYHRSEVIGDSEDQEDGV